jgi:hypothetical protein
MVDSVSLMSLLSGALAAQSTDTQAGLITLKKTNDIAKTEGEALVQMLEESTQISKRLLDIYA